MYKQYKDMNGQVYTNAIIRVSDGATIPFAPGNTDYQAFKKDIAEGKTLQDADGNEMSAEAAQEFMRNLP